MSGESISPRLARVFCALFVLGVLGVPAGAKYGGGVGVADNPYLIQTAGQLRALGVSPGDWDKHFKLTADIDLSAYAPEELHAIGNADDGPFTGIFDGNHKVISGLRMVSDFNCYLGLFGLIEGPEARVENVTLVEPNIVSPAGRYLGGLAGSLQEGTVSNCHVRAGNVLGLSFVGGLVGNNDGGTIVDCTALAAVQGASRVGGLLGYCYYGVVERCRATGQVRGDESSYWMGGLVGRGWNAAVRDCRASCTVEGDRDVGGLMGENLTGTIDRCCAAGVVRGGSDTGGLLGLNSGGTVSDCYATADVKALIYVGGLVGCNGPSCHCIVYEPGLVVRSYAAGPVWGVDSGGLVGISDRGETRASFWNVETSGSNKSDGGEGRSTWEMGDTTMYLAGGWDFVAEKANGTNDIWYMPADGSYPRLAWELAGGDFNADGGVDFRDYSRLAAKWRQAGAGDDYTIPAGIVDFDALMNFADLWLHGRK